MTPDVPPDPRGVRLFVVLTQAEARALLQLGPDPDAEALRALAKIRTALESAR
jgi:hypothetical protein